MSHLRRQTYTGDDGKKHKLKKLYLCFTYPSKNHGHTLPLFEDKRASEKVQAKIDDLISLKAGGAELTKDLSEWLLKDCPADLRDRLASIGLITKQRQSAGETLLDHVTDFVQHLENNKTSKGKIQTLNSRLIRFINDTGVKSFSDFTPPVIEKFLAGLMVKKENTQTGKGQRKMKDGIGYRTRNDWLQNIREFLRWARNFGLTHTTLEPIKKLKPQLDIRHGRRVLTLDETNRLLNTTAAGPDRVSVPGVTRALLYRLALETGLRREELCTLNAGCFNFNLAKCTVTVTAANAKNKKTATLPLRQSTADLLEVHLQNKLPTARAFNLPYKDTVTDLLKADQTAAGIPWQDPETKLFADFHALRHTFITRLAESGVHPKIAQELARHSDINLTMNYYTHVRLEKLSEAVNLLPGVTAEEAGVTARTA